MGETISITRRYSLPALHTLSGPGLTEAENQQVFGACSRLHGHEYLVEVTLSGPVNESTGLLFGRDQMDGIVERTILRPFRGTNLSDHFSHTTGESLALEFFRLLEPAFARDVSLAAVAVRETAKNFFIASPPRQAAG